MTREIDIHRGLGHIHIVDFHGFFEDKDHVYILLELCRYRSLEELHRRRKVFTEPEVRYFLRQILLAVKYLHEEKVKGSYLERLLNYEYLPILYTVCITHVFHAHIDQQVWLCVVVCCESDKPMDIFLITLELNV